MNRRGIQFSLLSMLVLVALVAVLLAIVSETQWQRLLLIDWAGD